MPLAWNISRAGTDGRNSAHQPLCSSPLLIEPSIIPCPDLRKRFDRTRVTAQHGVTLHKAKAQGAYRRPPAQRTLQGQYSLSIGFRTRALTLLSGDHGWEDLLDFRLRVCYRCVVSHGAQF